MAKSSPFRPFIVLRESWEFLCKQPVLFWVLGWFLIVPAILLDVVDLYWPQSDVPSIEQIGDVGYILAQVVLGVIALWGFACILLVGRRQVLNRAGRARTSFRSVRRECIPLILPLFFTSLLRTVITLEWAMLAIIPAILFILVVPACHESVAAFVPALWVSVLAPDLVSGMVKDLFSQCGLVLAFVPLLIPALIYQLRTAFYGIVLASENLRLRDALRRSRIVTRGKLLRIIGVLTVFCLVLFVPAALIEAGVTLAQTMFLPDLPILAQAIADCVYSFAGLLFLLALITLYGKLYKAASRVQEVIPDTI